MCSYVARITPCYTNIYWLRTTFDSPLIHSEEQYFSAIDTFLSQIHYSDAIMSAMTSQITGISFVYSIVCSDADQRKHQSSASLAFVRGIHLRQVNSPHKGPVTRKMFPFDDVIMYTLCATSTTADSLITRLLTSTNFSRWWFIQAQMKQDIEAPRHWPLCGEFTGDRWIPRTNGQ